MSVIGTFYNNIIRGTIFRKNYDTINEKKIYEHRMLPDESSTGI